MREGIVRARALHALRCTTQTTQTAHRHTTVSGKRGSAFWEFQTRQTSGRIPLYRAIRLSTPQKKTLTNATDFCRRQPVHPSFTLLFEMLRLALARQMPAQSADTNLHVNPIRDEPCAPSDAQARCLIKAGGFRRRNFYSVELSKKPLPLGPIILRTSPFAPLVSTAMAYIPNARSTNIRSSCRFRSRLVSFSNWLNR